MRNPISILGAFLVLAAHPAFAASPAEKAVLDAVDTWKVAMLKQDRAALEKILHPDLTYGYPSAIVHTKAEAIQHVVEGAGWEAIDLTDTKVHLEGNVAIVNGKVDMHNRVKGQPTTISKMVVLTVWVKGKQGWQLIARQAARRADDPQVLAAKAALAATAAKAPAAPAPATAAK
jgi:ketosteroid isomerase-like protein